MEYKARQGVVVYRSKLHTTVKLNFQIIPRAAKSFAWEEEEGAIGVSSFFGAFQGTAPRTGANGVGNAVQFLPVARP